MNKTLEEIMEISTEYKVICTNYDIETKFWVRLYGSIYYDVILNSDELNKIKETLKQKEF